MSGDDRDRKIDARLVTAVLVGLVAVSTSWSALAGAHHKKAGVAHARYYLYEPPQHALPSVSRQRDDREFCNLPSEGCDNNHTMTN
jgi:hypothetical protein